MVSLRNGLRAAVLACCAAGLSACGSPGMGLSGQELSKPDKDIVQIATGDHMDEVKTVVMLLGKADLVSTLQGPGPFTVFAPTNQAFEDLEKAKPGTLETLQKPENKQMLKNILLYHVVPGHKTSTDIMSMQAETALPGKMIDVQKNGDVVTLNGSAKVIKADILAKNGVIHWIDHVLMPPTN